MTLSEHLAAATAIVQSCGVSQADEEAVRRLFECTCNKAADPEFDDPDEDDDLDDDLNELGY